MRIWAIIAQYTAVRNEVINLMEHKKFYDMVRDTHRNLGRTYKNKVLQLQKDRESGKFSDDFIRDEEQELKAYRLGQKKVLQDEIKSIRERYLKDLQRNYSPMSGVLSEELQKALGMGITFTPSELQMMMKEAHTTLDARVIAELASRQGYEISGFVPLEKRIADFDKYCSILTADAPEEYEGFESYEDIMLEDAYQIYQSVVDKPTEVTIYKKPTSFEDMAAVIASDMASRGIEPDISPEDESAFRIGAEMTAEEPIVSRDDVLKDLAAQEALKAVESARKSREDESPEQAAYRETAKVLSEIVKNQREAPAE